MYSFSVRAVQMHELKQNLSALAELAAQGETIEITKHNKPYVRLMPATAVGLHIGQQAGKRFIRTAVRKNTRGAFLKVLAADRA
jgi:prevent-host-death family protein